jgi:peptidoglycan/xylan/chitin deacetylase (PgdA/CDA1 family)
MLDAALDRIGGPRGCCLTFHRVARRADRAQQPDAGFHVELERLDAILGGLLRAGWDIVTMDEALRRDARGRRFVNISIDDAYRDTFDLLVPLFRHHGVPVTVYVTTGIPDGSYELWSAGLETILMERDAVVVRGPAETWPLPDAAARRAAFQRLHAAWDGTEAVAAYHGFCADNGYDPAELRARHAITWDMLRSWRNDPCVEIGAHTISHPRISALSAEAAHAEMAGGKQRLEEMLSLEIRHFAFPFGRRGDCGPRDFAIARDAGFASAATTTKGLIRAGAATDPYRLPRNTLNGERANTATLQAHLTGLSGLVARMTGRN